MDIPIIVNFPADYTCDEIEELKNSCVDMLIFDENFKGDLCTFEFPDTIFYLEINSNSSLAGVNLPKYLKKLKFGETFNQALENVELPDSLEVLEFFNYKNSLFSVKLPKSLKKIINRTRKNELVTVNLPTDPLAMSTLYSLPFFLPNNVKKINLGSQYNYKTNAFIFPKKLKKLAISGDTTNKILFYEMYDELKTLTSLEILEKLDFSIDKLPDNIKKLKLSYEHDNTKISINIPRQLEHLKISGNKCNESIINNLPINIKSLEIINTLEFDLNNLSTTLEKIYFNFTPIKITPTILNDVKKTINLQESIKKILFSNTFDCSKMSIKLPSELEHLKISGKKYNEQIINNLPQNLQSLEIINCLEFELNNLPFSLKELFINVFNENMTLKHTNLPAGLKTIKIFRSYSEIYLKKPFDCEIIILDD